MVYATCSIFCEENEKIVEKFLQNNKQFDYVVIRKNKDENNIKDLKYIQLYQAKENDGFFICKFQKK